MDYVKVARQHLKAQATDGVLSVKSVLSPSQAPKCSTTDGVKSVLSVLSPDAWDVARADALVKATCNRANAWMALAGQVEHSPDLDRIEAMADAAYEVRSMVLLREALAAYESAVRLVVGPADGIARES